MRSALIITGREGDYWELGKDFESYLRLTAGLRGNVSLVDGWNRPRQDLKLPFFNYATRAGRQPFLLVYIGHGYKDKNGETGWSYGVKNASVNYGLPYVTLLEWLIESREGPTLVLNDCCYAGVFNDLLASISPQLNIAAISASKAKGYCYGDMSTKIIESWQKREAYVPKIYTRDRGQKRHNRAEESRHGPELDHHFFPQVPKKPA